MHEHLIAFDFKYEKKYQDCPEKKLCSMVCSFHFKGLLFTRLIGIVRLQVASFCVLERRKGRVKEVKKRGIEGKEPLVWLNGGELGADRK